MLSIKYCNRFAGSISRWKFITLQSYTVLASILLHAVKSYDMGPAALLPIQTKACCGFLSP
jgi:hypothetical protein